MPAQVTLLGAVRGLESEGKRVEEALGRMMPDAIAISLSREALDSFAQLAGDGRADPNPTNPEEEAYIRGLSRFGEVIKPPPCFYRAWAFARDAGMPAEPLDMDDEHYTLAYCKHVGTLDMMRQGRSRKLFEKHDFAAETAEDFVLEWDALVNRLRGYQSLERAREAWIARGISDMAGSEAGVVAVIELERLDGVRAELARAGISPTVL